MLLKLITTVLFVTQCEGFIYLLNETEYALMPPLYHLDPYEPCVERGGEYCSMNVELVSDRHSQLLDMIQDYSKYRRVYWNHSRLHYGICVHETCKRVYENTTGMDLESNLEACINESLYKDYGIKAKLIDKAKCHVKKSFLEKIDIYDVIVAVAITLLLLFNMLGTLLYDDEEKQDNKVNNLLGCYSLKRNWKKLVSVDERNNGMRGIHGARFLVTSLVIGGHSGILFVFGIDNTHHYEQVVLSRMLQVFGYGTIISQAFFAISAFLLAYNIEVYVEKNGTLNVRTGLKYIICRWLRLMPTFAVVLALTATWVKFTQSGPLWQTAIGNEMDDCRRYWWMHLLLIQNYAVYSQCRPESWYLASDIQLHILAIIILITTKGSVRKWILGALLVMGVASTMLQTYFQNLDETFLLTPETGRTLTFDDPTFLKIYTKVHGSLASFVIGLLFGLFTFSIQRKGGNLDKYYKYTSMHQAYFLGCIMIPLSCYVLNDKGATSAYFRAICQGFMKPTFVLFVCILVSGVCLQYDNSLNAVFKRSIWVMPSRLCYCTYVINILLARLYSATRPFLIRGSGNYILGVILTTIPLTFIAAIPLWLLVEAPTAQLLSLYQKKEKTKAERHQKSS